MPFFERRKYPRISEALPCQIQVGPSALAVQTQNVSCGGALCQLPQPIPLMTKLEIVLELPSLSGSLPQSIRCIGVVVRQEPSSPGNPPTYLTGIYFSEIKLEDRRRLAEFVLQSMLSHDRRRS